MNEQQKIIERVESSFLFTRDEKEALMLLCVTPEFAEVVKEQLFPYFDAEDGTAKTLSSAANKESLAMAREIEAAESHAERHEQKEIHSVLV